MMMYLTEFPIRSRYSLSKESVSSTSIDRTIGGIGNSGDIFADGPVPMVESWTCDMQMLRDFS